MITTQPIFTLPRAAGSDEKLEDWGAPGNLRARQCAVIEYAPLAMDIEQEPVCVNRQAQIHDMTKTEQASV